VALIGHEGGNSAVREDPGNWTGGAVGRGILRGTKYGISAAAFPTLDIQGLTLEQARDIYRALYWDKMGCAALPFPLAFLVFDAAVNNGNGNSAKFLQQAVGAAADGLIGTATRAAIARTLGNGSPERVDALCAEFQARRMVFMAGLSTWRTFGLGWARRLCAPPFQALRLATANNDTINPPRVAA
jgi:lysozyme family protein